jgi:hypothetical protein
MGIEVEIRVPARLRQHGRSMTAILACGGKECPPHPSCFPFLTAVIFTAAPWRIPFLRVPGAPLDNNICEQALKMAIRRRKKSLFYKTMRGAQVGDLYMSLIHTCYFSGADPKAGTGKTILALAAAQRAEADLPPSVRID